ncbi:MAG: GNAT family N-acetyltransferase [Treponema sp.]|jgi:GNAT superfamily N-acetyltransferase|nr:GNAT family N-acetyltransferase [Treponema sp.]
MHHFQINEHVQLRFAKEQDIPLVLRFIRELAEYEHLLDQVEVTEAALGKTIFQDKTAEVIICEYADKPAGFALFFHNFSTFLGKPGIYIEDIFVLPALRGKGLGTIILSFIAVLAEERHCGRLEWACLNWNKPAIAFYKNQRARPLTEWTTYRITGENLQALAKSR